MNAQIVQQSSRLLRDRQIPEMSEGTAGIIEVADLYRLHAGRLATDHQRASLGQFLTSASIAKFMAKLSEPRPDEVRLLDPGAGVGSLTAAWVDEMLARKRRPKHLHLVACEIDPQLLDYLGQTLTSCQHACARHGVGCDFEIISGDFIAAATEWVGANPLFAAKGARFDTIILNPPYKKIRSDSDTRRLLSGIGIETSNLYSAFLWLAVELSNTDGEIIAITPRSFCNGPYFRPFRIALLTQMQLTRVHLFDSRKSAFHENDVLQENVIFRATKSHRESNTTLVSTSNGPDDPDVIIRNVPPSELVQSDDADRNIHLVANELQGQLARDIASFTSSLGDLGIGVSTGRVVDFRAKESLAMDAADIRPGTHVAPLIYPTHLENGAIKWPKAGKKPNYLVISEDTAALLVPAGTYVLAKRFSAKEERRRITAAICTPDTLVQPDYAFENHLNYYHQSGKGLSPLLARGLAVYLNSTLVDSYFRQFSGHTQVNATDLRKLPYPSKAALERLGKSINGELPGQDAIDHLIAKELDNVSKKKSDPVCARKRVDEALAILKILGVPRPQQNDRSALTLLALTAIKPRTPWAKAASPLMGITPIMDFARDHYGTTYAPNTRETFRRQTMHQFVEAAIALYNPDKLDRPVNSPNAVYQIVPLLLDLLRTFGTEKWDQLLADWSKTVVSLKIRYAREREMTRIPLKLPSGEQIELSPGGQNVLVEQIIHEFCPRFTPGGTPVYVGDTEEKYAYFNKAALGALGVKIDSHGKMPDVAIHDGKRNWLVLIEAVTSHGPVDGKRRDELKRIFATSTAPLVFVTAFMDRSAMVRFLNDISWETEVWVADAPSHMIHFNGERFLGPYEQRS